jgi:hypothetical protein
VRAILQRKPCFAKLAELPNRRPGCWSNLIPEVVIYDMAATNYFDDAFLRLTSRGLPLLVAVEQAATAYVDGKPLRLGKKKLTRKERDSLFWSSNVVKDCPPDAWNTEAMVLALARYLGQEPVAAEGLMTRVAREAPDALIRAVRYSGLVRTRTPRDELNWTKPQPKAKLVSELCRVLDLFAVAHRERVAAVEAQKARLAELSVFDVLLYASLYAFEVLWCHGTSRQRRLHLLRALISSSPGMRSMICSRGSSRAPAARPSS